MTPFLFALWLALDVQGSITCPTPTEVSQHLAQLVSDAPAARAQHAYLSAGEGFVTIELLDPDGSLLAERRLERAASCAEMAEAAAVVLATWQSSLVPTLSPAVTPPQSPAATVAVAPPVIRAQRSVLFDVGVGVLTSVVNSEPTLGAKLEAILSLSTLPLGFHLALSLSSAHAQTFSKPVAEAQWIRPAASLGPNLRLRGTSLGLDVHGDAVLALLHLKGSGLSQNSSDTSAQVGIAAGLRGLWLWNDGAVWVGADLLDFPGQDNLVVGNYGQIGHLPHLELQVSLGVALGRFR